MNDRHGVLCVLRSRIVPESGLETKKDICTSKGHFLKGLIISFLLHAGDLKPIPYCLLVLVELV